MNLVCRMITSALIVLLIGAIPALGQTDIVKGRDGLFHVDFGLYSDRSSGNQDWVREYDGRMFDLWGIDLLSSYGYTGDYQYWFQARSLLPGDEDLSLGLGVRDELGLSVKTTSMLHRLARIPGNDPYLSPLGLTGGAFTDMTPGNPLSLRWRVDQLGLRLTPGAGAVTLRANWWRESDTGATQFNYRGSSPSRMESVDFGADRSTEQGTLGADFRLGRSTSLSYSYEDNSFSDGGRPVMSAVDIDDPRPWLVTIPSIKTTSNVIKARSRLSNRLYFSGAHIDRSRANQTAAIVDSAAVKTRATNASLTFLASGDLTLFGRYRDYRLDNRVSPLLGDVGDPADNVALERRERSLQFESDYSGIQKALVRIGYEHRKTERNLPDGFPDDPDLAAAMESATTSDILRASFNYHPGWRLSLSGKMEDWNISKPSFKGSPGGRRKTGLNATYLSSEKLVFYADYGRLHDTRDDPSGLDNKSTDATIGAWYGLSDKLNLDVLYADSKVNATTLWELSPHALDPISSEDVPYRVRNKQYSVGLNLRFAPKTSLYWRFLRSDSSGKSLVTALVPGSPTLPDGWAPLEVGENRWTIGFTRDLTAQNRVLLEYSLADWEDDIDANNDGRFNLWRVAWSTDF